jgi:hypothetical protein
MSFTTYKQKFNKSVPLWGGPTARVDAKHFIRIYSAVMGGPTTRVDAKHLIRK